MTDERISRIERITAVGTEVRVDELTGVPFVREALPDSRSPAPCGTGLLRLGPLIGHAPLDRVRADRPGTDQ